jgi:hypothetical protein
MKKNWRTRHDSNVWPSPSEGKVHATAKGNATKPEMQVAAKERWGADLGEDEANAACAGAFALDAGLFT